MIVAYLAALPSLRLRDDYFAIVTLAFAEIIRITAKSSELLEFTVLGVRLGTGGGRGIRTFPNPIDQFFEGVGAPLVDFVISMGIDGSLVSGWAFVLVLAVVLSAVYLFIVRLGESPFGRVLKGIRDDEEATSSLAKNTGSFKIRAFVLGCAVLGLLGILWQGSQGYIDPTLFVPQLTFFVWIAVIIGGAGSNTGTVIGTILFVGIVYQGPNYLRRLVENFVDVGGISAGTFPSIINSLIAGDTGPILVYTLEQTSALRIVLTGIFLIWLLKRRPEGIFGDRREIASPIDIESKVADRRKQTETTSDDE
jgi:branched-chain amino acid transport system permease protein